jgi:hypothetical protein
MEENNISVYDIFSLDRKISLEAKGLLSLINGLINNDDHSLKKIYEMCNEDKSFVDNLVIELLDNGYLFLSTIRDDSGKDIFYVFDIDNFRSTERK